VKFGIKAKRRRGFSSSTRERVRQTIGPPATRWRIVGRPTRRSWPAGSTPGSGGNRSGRGQARVLPAKAKDSGPSSRRTWGRPLRGGPPRPTGQTADQNGWPDEDHNRRQATGQDHPSSRLNAVGRRKPAAIRPGFGVGRLPVFFFFYSGLGLQHRLDVRSTTGTRRARGGQYGNAPTGGWSFGGGGDPRDVQPRGRGDPTRSSGRFAQRRSTRGGGAKILDPDPGPLHRRVCTRRLPVISGTWPGTVDVRDVGIKFFGYVSDGHGPVPRQEAPPWCRWER